MMAAVGRCGCVSYFYKQERAMKKILLITPSFHHGGTNKVLENILATQKNNGYELYILAMDYRGVYKQTFAKYNLLKENAALGVFAPLNEVRGWQKLKRVFWKTIFKLFYKNNIKAFYALIAKKSKMSRYDAIVAFQEGLTTEVVSNIPAKRRIAWVHSDYSSYLKIARKTDEKETYDAFDNVVCVSKYTTETFVSHYPQYKERAQCIYNVIDFKGIIEKAKEHTDTIYSNQMFTIISIGRMDPVKRFTHIPAIAKRMLSNGCQFKWYIMGGGGTQENEVRTAIKENGVEGQVVMLGEKSNPYPYIQRAAALVCLSTTEACPNIINEAKILHVPVVATDFPTVFEYLEHEQTGIIATIDTLSDVLTRICKDAAYYDGLKQRASAFQYNNELMERQLEKLFLE